MDQAVLYETRGAVAIITINRPERRNSLGAAVRSGIREGFLRFEADDALKVGILTAVGDQAFCAGMDLKEAADAVLRVPPRGHVPIIGDDLVVTKPTISAVNGVAMAGGWLMAQMCDLCVAADTARFAITEAKVGRGTPWAVPLMNMLPQRVTLEILMTGDFVSAQRLYELGYVNKVVPLAALLDEALALANRIADNAPLTVRACREMIHTAAAMGRTGATETAHEIFKSVYLSDDAQEGPLAFSQKRKPVWTGK